MRQSRSKAVLLVLAASAAAAAQQPAKPAPAPPAAQPARPAPRPDARPPIRVLYLADAPRWDFRYLRAILAHTPDVALRVSLRGAAAGGEFVAPPATRADFDACDVILVSDLAFGGDGKSPPGVILELAGFLLRGGGVAFLCAEQVPARLHSALLDDLLPVRLLPERQPPAERITARLLPPADAPLHPILRLEASQDPRADFAQLRPVRYVPTVQLLAPGTQVLLADPEHPVDGRPAVVAAAGRHGQGRTVFVGTDETWAWRDPWGEQFQAAFWRNVVRFLAGRL